MTMWRMVKGTLWMVLSLAAFTAPGVMAGQPGRIDPFAALDRIGAWEFAGRVFYLAGPYCPANTLPTDGRLLPVGENTTLFDLLGTRFGGDGQQSFGLPQHVAPGGLTACIVVNGQPGLDAAGQPIPIPNETPLVSQVVLRNCAPDEYRFAPTDGRLLLVSQNVRLYATIGSRYGGNRQTSFALPSMPGSCISLDGVFPPRP